MLFGIRIATVPDKSIVFYRSRLCQAPFPGRQNADTAGTGLQFLFLPVRQQCAAFQAEPRHGGLKPSQFAAAIIFRQIMTHLDCFRNRTFIQDQKTSKQGLKQIQHFAFLN